MVEEKKEIKETKKLDDLKETPENKAAIAEAEGKAVEVKEESKPAVEKVSDNKKKDPEKTVELEREYVVPLRKGVLKVPRYKRAKKAIRVLKEFLAKNMKVEGRDLNKVRIDINLNNEIWFKGIKKPMNRVKVKAKKIDGIVYAELAEVPEIIKYKIARLEKRKVAVTSKPKVTREEKKLEEDLDKDGVPDEIEKKEDLKAGSEKEAKVEKAAAIAVSHTTNMKHEKKSMPKRKVLK